MLIAQKKKARKKSWETSEKLGREFETLIGKKKPWTCSVGKRNYNAYLEVVSLKA